jgi:hypothetical protein
MRSDREIEELRKAVDCRVLLERDGWALDRKESTRKAVKYRRGQGEIIIVIHEGRGWFDPLSDKKGDVFNLAQALWGSSFGAARVALRPFAGVAPAPQEWMREHHAFPALTPQCRWNRRGSPRRSSPTWRYLVEVRGIPPDIVAVVIANGLLREGPRGSMWAAHHDHGGVLTGWEERGPHWRGFSRDGTKVLFRLGASEPRRLSRSCDRRDQPRGRGRPCARHALRQHGWRLGAGEHRRACGARCQTGHRANRRDRPQYPGRALCRPTFRARLRRGSSVPSIGPRS